MDRVLRRAQVAELVDAHGSGPCAARCGGSSPFLGTMIKVRTANLFSFQVLTRSKTRARLAQRTRKISLASETGVAQIVVNA